jgi:hypothetical protein
VSTYYFIVGLTYLIIGFGMGLVYFYGFKKDFLGKVWGAAIVGIVGSFAGGLADYFLKDRWVVLANLFGSVNIFPPLGAAALFLWVFHKSFVSSSDD